MKKQAKIKTFAGTNTPYFDVIIPQSNFDGTDLLCWGIGETKDLSIINHLNDDFAGINRSVAQAHKSEMGKSMLKNGYSYGIAVCIYKGKLYRVDGNHRAEWLGDNGYPIRFSFRHVDTFAELVSIVIGFNNSAKNWGLGQYIQTYISMGLDAYVTLQKATKHGLTNTVTAAIIAETTVAYVKKDLREGTLTCKNEKGALTKVIEISRFLENFGIKDQRSGEGLVSFIQKVGYTNFLNKKSKLCTLAVKLVQNGELIGKGKGKTAGAKEYYDLYLRAYEHLS